MTVRSDVNIDEEWHDACYFARLDDEPQPNRGAIEAWAIGMLLKWNHCTKHGHDFVDDGSFANNETAVDNMHCKLCGFSHSHTYY